MTATGSDAQPCTCFAENLVTTFKLAHDAEFCKFIKDNAVVAFIKNLSEVQVYRINTPVEF